MFNQLPQASNQPTQSSKRPSRTSGPCFLQNVSLSGPFQMSNLPTQITKQLISASSALSGLSPHRPPKILRSQEPHISPLNPCISFADLKFDISDPKQACLALNQICGLMLALKGLSHHHKQVFNRLSFVPHELHQTEQLEFFLLTTGLHPHCTHCPASSHLQ